jgi:hypothetical protein
LSVLDKTLPCIELPEHLRNVSKEKVAGEPTQPALEAIAEENERS